MGFIEMSEEYYLVVHSCGREYRYPRSKYRDHYQNWPIPDGVDLTGLVGKMTDRDINNFVKWALNNLRVHPLEFFSPLRRKDIVSARAIIAYSLRCLGASTYQISRALRRDRSSIKNLFSYSFREWGEKLEPICSLLLDWDIYSFEKVRPSRKN